MCNKCSISDGQYYHIYAIISSARCILKFLPMGLGEWTGTILLIQVGDVTGPFCEILLFPANRKIEERKGSLEHTNHTCLLRLIISSFKKCTSVLENSHIFQSLMNERKAMDRLDHSGYFNVIYPNQICFCFCFCFSM